MDKTALKYYCFDLIPAAQKRNSNGNKENGWLCEQNILLRVRSLHCLAQLLGNKSPQKSKDGASLKRNFINSLNHEKSTISFLYTELFLAALLHVLAFTGREAKV